VPAVIKDQGSSKVNVDTKGIMQDMLPKIGKVNPTRGSSNRRLASALANRGDDDDENNAQSGRLIGGRF